MNNIKTLGVMLDCSRNAVMKPEKVKEFAETISKMGYNALKLYTEDTYTIDDNPYFGYQRGRYSKDELRDISRFCDSKGIELIPCIQTLAHLNAISRWDDYSDYIDAFDILLAGDDRTYELINHMFDTLEECFISRRVNIGMDEAHFIGLGKYLDIHGYQNRSEILLKHLNKVTKIAEKHGFSIMMWSDMFFRLGGNGEYSTENGQITNIVKDMIPKSVSLVYWDYYSTSKEHYDKSFASHKNIKDDIAFAGGVWTWSGFTPNLKYSIEASMVAIKSAKDNDIDSVFMTMWGDDGKECSFFSGLSALFAAAEFSRDNYDIKSIKIKFKNIFGYEFDDFMKLELPNLVDETNSNTNNPSKYLLYNDPFLRLFDLSVNSDMPEQFKKSAMELKKYVDGREYSYLFESAMNLSRALAVKVDLGVKTALAYQKKNKDELLRIANQDYTDSINNIKEFYISFKKLWMKENKSFGFEVQTARIGGLIFRLENCRQEIIDYCNGNLDKIAELDEKVLPINEDSINKQFNYNNYKTNITTSVM